MLFLITLFAINGILFSLKLCYLWSQKYARRHNISSQSRVTNFNSDGGLGTLNSNMFKNQVIISLISLGLMLKLFI